MLNKDISPPMRKLILFCILIFCLFPRGVFAEIATHVVISEIQVDGGVAGGGIAAEWIEIQNTGKNSINLGNWQLDDSPAGSKPFRIPDSVMLYSGEYRVFPRSFTKLALNNSGSEAVRLFDCRGKLVASVGFRDIPEGVSYSRESDGEFRATKILTANQANSFDTEKLKGKIIFIGDDGFIIKTVNGEKFILFGSSSEALIAKALFTIGGEWKVFVSNNSSEAILSSFEISKNLLEAPITLMPKLDSGIPWLFSSFFLLIGFFISLRVYLRKRLLEEKA